MTDETKNLLNSAQKNLMFVIKRSSIVMAKGNGMYLWDTAGKKYLDFIGGWAVTALGHCPKVVINAIKYQAKQLINCSPAFYNKAMIELAELLINNSCMDKIWFGNTGAEVNEAAVKLARKYGAKNKNGAYEIITTINSFHGRTLSMMAATGKESWKNLFSPSMPGFIHVPFNNLDAIKKAISDKTIAIMLEPVQGEGGAIPASNDYIAGLRKICNEQNIILIFDEIQTGLGRTGKLFCYQNYNVEPDIMTLAKGLGGGFPVSALLSKNKFSIFEAGEHGGTFGGNPLAMAVAYAVVKKILDKNLSTHVFEMSIYLQNKLNDISPKYKLSNLRGKGLLIAIDLPDSIGEKITTKALDFGLILNSPRASSLRFIPPLIVQKKHIDEMIEKFTKTLDSL